MDNNLKAKLKQLNLTKQEIKIYTTLLQKDNLSAKEIAQTAAILPNAVYRTTKSLNKKGFVTVTNSYPTTFRAIYPHTAISLAIKNKIKNLESLNNKINNLPPLITSMSPPTNIDLIYGANKIFEHAAKMLDFTKKEMLVISIGEVIPPNLLLSVKKANDRSVEIKMIVHKHDKKNKTVLENLKKNGYKIRHYPGWGFHIAIYDKEKSILIVNNPDNTNERAAMFISSVGLSKALSDYFNSIWRKAKII